MKAFIIPIQVCCRNPGYWFIFFIYDQSGDVKDVKFIRFENLMGEDSGALNFSAELDDAGLIEDFQKAVKDV